VLGCSILRRPTNKGATFALHFSQAMRHPKVYHNCLRSLRSHHLACSTRSTWLYFNSDKRSSRLLSTCNSLDFSSVLRPWEYRRCRQADLRLGCLKQTYNTLYNLRLDSSRSIKVYL
jgi:hypothetical protein